MVTIDEEEQVEKKESKLSLRLITRHWVCEYRFDQFM
jgi:hypothetical protein